MYEQQLGPNTWYFGSVPYVAPPPVPVTPEEIQRETDRQTELRIRAMEAEAARDAEYVRQLQAAGLGAGPAAGQTAEQYQAEVYAAQEAARQAALAYQPPAPEDVRRQYAAEHPLLEITSEQIRTGEYTWEQLQVSQILYPTYPPAPAPSPANDYQMEVPVTPPILGKPSNGYKYPGISLPIKHDEGMGIPLILSALFFLG